MGRGALPERSTRAGWCFLGAADLNFPSVAELAVPSMAAVPEAGRAGGSQPAPIQREMSSSGPIHRTPSMGSFPASDSWAYSHNEDLGFSMFLERRCKLIQFIRHAEAAPYPQTTTPPPPPFGFTGCSQGDMLGVQHKPANSGGERVRANQIGQPN